MKTVNRLVVAVMFATLVGCSSMQQFNAMTPTDRADYVAFADRMTVDQRKTYLAKGTSEARMAYLKEIGLYDEFSNKTSFTRLEEEKRHDFLKAYLNATPEELQRMLAAYDDDTRDRIVQKDLQYGWKKEEVILSLGKPVEIFEAKAHNGATNQLWVYDQSGPATYVYFKNGALSNWVQ